MKKLLFALLTLAVLSSPSCSKTNDQVLVRFHNTLSEDIQDARMEFDDTHETAVGNIPAGGHTDFIAFDYFQVGDNLPMGLLIGNSGDGELMAWSGLWCGTGVEFKQLAPGQYTLEIEQVDGSEPVFYLLKFAE